MMMGVFVELVIAGCPSTPPAACSQHSNCKCIDSGSFYFYRCGNLWCNNVCEGCHTNQIDSTGWTEKVAAQAALWVQAGDVEALSRAFSDVATEMADQKAEWLKRLNYFRWKQGVPYFKWQDNVAWAAWHCVTTQGFKHCNSYNDKPPNGPAGENIASGYASIEAASWAWYNEIKKCKKFPGCQQSDTGHFTAMSWRGAAQLGCWMTPDKLYNCHFKGDDKLDCTTPNMQGCYTQNINEPVHTLIDSNSWGPEKTMDATKPAVNCAHCITQDGISKDNCNPSGFPGDERCVCGPRSQDWTSNCWGGEETMNATKPAINCAHCITLDGIQKYNCNPSGFPGDERCVCGPRSQDWTSNCWGVDKTMNATKPAINCAHCITQDGIQKYNCNPSGFPGDERCVCGPRSQDWTSNCWGTQKTMDTIAI